METHQLYYQLLIDYFSAGGEPIKASQYIELPSIIEPGSVAEAIEVLKGLIEADAIRNWEKEVVGLLNHYNFTSAEREEVKKALELWSTEKVRAVYLKTSKGSTTKKS
ncbi:MAG: hypothetical protein F6J89_12305 [Symploca sp. SIO1C4]|uniref:Uncharacterized protein n=1 Tax=Symploca sp. SIO1C4 TaxID=2607765 RepID=A0A6B3NE25_9CYAN|nr:hypothetical protein [Symploca sp. SIO1C4]